MNNRTCRFCAIVAGREETLFVFESSTAVGFLDRRPLFPGHVLVVPKDHFETLPDLPEAVVGPLFRDVRVLAEVVELAMGAEGTFVACNNTVSQSVPHLHVHVVPRRRKDGLRGFFWPRTPYRDRAHAEEVQRLIRDAVRRVDGSTGPS